MEPKFAGSNPIKAMDFKGDKNPQHTLISDGMLSRMFLVVKFYGT
jgi:hypothetical protein